MDPFEEFLLNISSLAHAAYYLDKGGNNRARRVVSNNLNHSYCILYRGIHLINSCDDYMFISSDNLKNISFIMDQYYGTFIEFATKSGNIDLQMQEIYIPERSGLAGLTLDHCGIGRELGIIIVAIKRASGDMAFNPTFRTTINEGDTMIVLGEVSKLKVLEELVLPRK